MVDDGSTDASPAIAEAFVERDERFRLVTPAQRRPEQAPATPASTRASGELPGLRRQRRLLAAERLRAAARRARRDRLRLRHGQRPAAARARARAQVAFLADDLREDAAQHARHRASAPLIADRIAWNKLFRARVLGRAGAQLPRGRAERGHPGDPARALRCAVGRRDRRPDLLLADRATASELSITQRRLEPQRAARPPGRDRAGRRLPRRARPRKWKRWYYESVVADDLRFYLNLLDKADAEYRELFLDAVNAFLDRAAPGRLRAAARDRAAEVAPRAAPPDARAARGPALPARGAARHAAGARSAAAGTATTPSATTSA